MAEMIAMEEEESYSYPEFKPPMGFMPEEGVEPGTEFEAIGTFKMKPDGTMCLVGIEGSRFEEGPEEVEEEEVVEEEVAPPSTEKAFADRLFEASQRTM